METFSEWLDRRPKGVPFFAFLNYFDAHDPYQPPAPYDTWFDSTGRAEYLRVVRAATPARQWPSVAVTGARNGLRPAHSRLPRQSAISVVRCFSQAGPHQEYPGDCGVGPRGRVRGARRLLPRQQPVPGLDSGPSDGSLARKGASRAGGRSIPSRFVISPRRS